MIAIEALQLTKFYGKARGIMDLDLTVSEGEYFGFIGPNGAGKSTTIRTLLGLISPTSGSAKILGLDIVRQKEAILRRVGYLPSEALFYSGMKVRDILQLSADLRKVNCKKRADELCERLQLDVNRRVDELSFGNRKKAAIVCAMQSDPELLILDEPTGGLDPLMQHEFFDILRERSNSGTTIFLSSHVLSEVQRNCSKAAVIREGRIIACDTVDALAKTNAKRVTVRGSFSPEGMEGIKDVKLENGSCSFLYSGEIQPLLHRLSASNILDLNISEPDLEEIFLHFYEKDGDRA